MTPSGELPETFNVSTAFLDHNLEHGRADRVAIHAWEREITYAALATQVNRAGNALRGLGMRRE